uniref:Uncharacterized protein n=1 Tax=Zea mays TaxID=4577 RepID=A0A804UB29_MAIZE
MPDGWRLASGGVLEIRAAAASARGGARGWRRATAHRSRLASFRAQLYFKEQHGDPPVASSTQLPAVQTGSDRWAHPLMKPEKGCLLIATEKLDGSHIFERTVILLLSSLGPDGVILNRPSLMSIKEASGSICADDADIACAFAGRPLFFGGKAD